MVGTILTLTLKDDAAALLTPGVYEYDVRKITASGALVPLAQGKCAIERVVTQAME